MAFQMFLFFTHHTVEQITKCTVYHGDLNQTSHSSSWHLHELNYYFYIDHPRSTIVKNLTVLTEVCSAVAIIATICAIRQWRETAHSYLTANLLVSLTATFSVVTEEHCVTTLKTAARETTYLVDPTALFKNANSEVQKPPSQ